MHTKDRTTSLSNSTEDRKKSRLNNATGQNLHQASKAMEVLRHTQPSNMGSDTSYLVQQSQYYFKTIKTTQIILSGQTSPHQGPSPSSGADVIWQQEAAQHLPPPPGFLHSHRQGHQRDDGVSIPRPPPIPSHPTQRPPWVSNLLTYIINT